MAGPIWVKLSGIIEDSAENDLVKEFFEKLNNKKVIKFGQPCISGRLPCKGKTKQAGS